MNRISIRLPASARRGSVDMVEAEPRLTVSEVVAFSGFLLGSRG